jgi:hypothetical protein
MGDEEKDQESPFHEMAAQQLAAKRAWVRLFIREARKRGEPGRPAALLVKIKSKSDLRLREFEIPAKFFSRFPKCGVCQPFL